jgi:hypothetical protein
MHIKDQLSKYFVKPLMRLKEELISNGFSESKIESIIPKEKGPYIFHKMEKKFKKNITSFISIFDYADINSCRVKKQHKIEKAYAQLKYHTDNLTKIVEEYHAELVAKVEPVYIDYDAMRADGWNGFHIHTEALEESIERSKILRKRKEYHKDIYDVITWWSVDSMCIWDWCFE